MDFPVGFCDVEETVKHILKQLAVALKQGDELFSTGLKVDCVPFGRIEGRGDLLHQCGRHLKRLLEGFNLVGGNAAIGLGHLGTQDDHTHGEGHLVVWFSIQFALLTRRPETKQGADLPSEREVVSSC